MSDRVGGSSQPGPAHAARARGADPIAIIGASARLPGAATLEEFWRLLSEGRDAVTEVPDGRWSKAFYFHPDPGAAGKSYTWAAGVLDRIDGFDAGFFGMSPREAEQVDPQQRLLLELAWEALEDSGIRAAALAGSETGVYVGFSSAEYANIRMGDPSGADAYFMTGTTPSIVANRLSYVFDLHGPSFVVDTACSSSLVALAQAVEALQAGRVPAALVGAVNLLLSPYPYVGFCRASMLSPSGRCFAFDARANGYVRAEGAGVVLLKRLSDAVRDGDRVRGVILGAGVNSDGRTVGLSLPNGAAQAALLDQVYGRAGVSAERLGFVEAHGTGTAAGDPIELGALGRVLGRTRSAPLWVGSVKTNVGHLETASGMAGLLKAMLALERRVLPPSLHFETPNPNIPFSDLNLRVAAEMVTLPSDGELMAGVNSFGFGGTNAHAILASPPPTKVAAGAAPEALAPLLLSARSREALQALAGDWAARLRAEPAAAAAKIRAAARLRDHHPERLVAWGGSAEAIASALEGSGLGRAEGRAVAGGLAFVYSGNGAQWVGMGREALAENAAFARAVEAVDAFLAPALGWSVAARLRADDSPDLMADTDVAQPLLFAVQVGIVDGLRAQGLTPAMHLGHSVGEIAAAWGAGALDLETACRVVVARSRAQQLTRARGRMAALGLGEEEAQAEIAALGGGLEIAAVNSPRSVTVAGPEARLLALKARAEREDWRFRLLDLDFAFHSAVMEPVREGLLADLAGVRGRSEGAALISTVEGRAVAGDALGPDYWWRNIRAPVRFDRAVAAALEAGARVFVEIGPAPILQSYVREALREARAEGAVTATLSRRPVGGDPFPQIAAELHVAGADLSAAPAYDGPVRPDGLPAYPWRRESYWSAPTSERVPIAAPAQDHPLLGYRWDAQVPVWKRPVDPELFPWIADHAVEGTPVLPAAAVLELALAAARAARPGLSGWEVLDLEIPRAMAFEPGVTREARVSLGEDGAFSLESRRRLSDEPWTLHAAARVAPAAPPPETTAAPAPPVDPADGFYAGARALGLDYGPAFQVVAAIAADGPRAVARFSAAEGFEGFLLAPDGVDGALQAFLALMADAVEPGLAFLPWRIGRARLHAPGRRPVLAEVRLTRRGARSAAGEAALFDAEGGLVATLSEVWFRRVRLRASGAGPDVYETVLVPAPLAAAPVDIPEAALRTGTGPAAPAGEAELLLEAFLAAGLHEALAGPAAPRQVSGAGSPGLAAGLRLLERHGLATRTGRRLELAADNPLGPATAIWRTLLDEAPASGPELALAAERVEALAAEARGAAAATPAATLLEQALTRSPAALAGRGALLDRLELVAADWPTGRPLRILELGSSAPHLARAVLDRLGAFGLELRYVAAARDESAAQALSAVLPRRPGVSAVPAGALETEGERFDVALGAFAQVRGEADLPARARRMLAPGGLLLLAEPAPQALLEMLLGETGSLAGPAAWTHRLREAGLDSCGVADGLGEGLWRAQLLVARAPAIAAPAAVAPPGLASVVVLAADLGLATECAALDAVTGRPDPEGARAALAAYGPLEPDEVALVLSPEAGLAAAGCELVALISAVAEHAPGARVRVVTRGAYSGAAFGAVQLGLVRTLFNERPDLDLRLLDLDPELPAAAAAAVLAQEAAGGREPEACVSAAGRFTPRVRAAAPPRRSGSDAVRLEVREPGRLDSLEWRPLALEPPPAGQVEIAVEAAGLNFRDVMWALDVLPEEALADGFAGPTLGFECAGVVTRVGPDVDDLGAGDRVLAFAADAFASRLQAPASAVVKAPADLDVRSAATVPVTYLTVLYALETVAALAPGETLLVHGGAGGVGLAAIHYAQHVGARVIASAGSEAKRAFLRRLGVDAVVDSRSLDFAEAVRALTDGQGVDVVLNSLNGEAMARSVGLVKPFGRFLELGKRDFFEGTRLGLRPFRRNIAYHGIDVDRIPRERPDLARRLLARVADLVAAGALPPLPYAAFGFSEAPEAFRLMQSAGHIGKVLLVPDGAPAAGPPAAALPLRTDAWQLVTGGLSGFGLATAEWLAGQGARRLALIGRRGAATPGAAEAVARLEAQGVEVAVADCDVADRAALAAVLEGLRARAPIGGVVHAAMALRDGLLSDMSADDLAAVLAPKLAGAEALDALTAEDPLTFFILYASAVTLLGAPGQGAYVAANLALEGLARRRAAAGRPALAVAWGPIGDVGVLARDEAARENLARRLAARPLAAAEALGRLPALLATGAPVAAVVEMAWEGVRSRLPIAAAPLFCELAAGGVGEAGLRERLETLAPEAARDLVGQVLVEEVARILGAAPDRVDPLRPLTELGMDSLMAVELRLALEARLGLQVPLMALSDSANLARLADRILAALDGASEDSDIALAAARHEGELVSVDLAAPRGGASVAAE